ncbi:hypothetical protein Bbelb_070950 [Branchiostoma belcheri]|nr:hypothetical protein Bbelb_070950 [Branchiostoma belcheri]
MEVEKGPWRVIVRVQESIRPDQRTDVHPSGLYAVSRLKAVLWHKMFGPWVTASARLVAQSGIKSLGRLLTTGAQTRLISAPVTSCVKARHRRTRRTVCAEIYGRRVQTCAGLYMARTPEWFISGPCAGPHTPSVRVAHTWKYGTVSSARTADTRRTSARTRGDEMAARLFTATIICGLVFTTVTTKSHKNSNGYSVNQNEQRVTRFLPSHRATTWITTYEEHHSTKATDREKMVAISKRCTATLIQKRPLALSLSPCMFPPTRS